MKDGLLRWRSRIPERRDEAPAIEGVRGSGCGEFCEFKQCRVKIDCLDYGAAASTGFRDTRSSHENWNAHRLLVIGVFAPLAVITEVPAMIAPENDDRFLGQLKAVQLIEHAANLRIHETHRGVVAVNEFALHIR